MSDINLSKAVRSNLLSLQNTSAMMGRTQERLATGNKVNSALDNPTNFFTASALNSRASDMANLMDSMANGIKTLEAADNGLKAITKTLESMQSTLRQARQDKSFQTTSYAIDIGDTPAGTEVISFTGGAVGTTAVEIALTQDVGGTDVALTTDEIVNAINTDVGLAGLIRASNDNGKLRIENLSTQELSINGVNADGVIDGVDVAVADDQAKIGGNTVRADLAAQFNELRDQLDKLADDASFNGINLLRGDNLKITFNETGTSEINIQSKDGKAINSANLGVETTLVAKDLDSDSSIDVFLGGIKSALNIVRSQASAFGSNLSVVQNRQEFTKNMINTLETGAANLTLADTNEEAANLLALQTRQAISSQTLSMASQADQAVLQLLR
jgi:flagellin